VKNLKSSCGQNGIKVYIMTSEEYLNIIEQKNKEIAKLREEVEWLEDEINKLLVLNTEK